VIVAWSNASTGSHWVKDEAAEGRDRGRLVPLLFDASVPPLGFRQIQAIDLSDWQGSGKPAAFDELLRAIDLLASSAERPLGVTPVQPRADAVRGPAASSRTANARLLLPVIALLVAAGAGAIFWLQKPDPNEIERPPAAPALIAPQAAAVPSDSNAGNADIDGRWSISWEIAGTPYRGVLVASGARAQIELDAETSMGRQSVRQDCSIAGSGPISISCDNVQVLSGPAGYMPDSFSLELVDRRTLRGTTSDPLGLVSAPVTAERE
jgi:hypothetical protein